MCIDILVDTEDVMLDVSSYKTSGLVERENIKYSETQYELCYIKLNLQDANLIPGQIYGLKLFAYNKGSKFVVPKSKVFKVMVVPHPVPGTIQVFNIHFFYLRQ